MITHYNTDINELLPLTPLDRQKKQFDDAGYITKKECTSDGLILLTVSEYIHESTQKSNGLIAFIYDGTGWLFQKVILL